MKIFRSLLAALLFGASVVVLADEPVNINTADAKTLAEAIHGVGVKRAEAIVSYRTRNGDFVSVDELTQVPGIGAKTVEKSREKLTVSTE